MDKFGSVIDRKNTKLGSKFLNFLRIKTQLLKELQRVIVVDGATHTQKDGVEGNGGSLMDGAEAFVLFLRGAQLFLRSSVLTVLDLDEVNFTLENTEIFGSVLSGEGGSVSGGGAAEVIPFFLSCPLPLQRTHPPSLLVCCFFVLGEMGPASTASKRLKVNLFLSWKRGGKSHFGIILDSAVLGI
jgi:hypothetical protein